MAFRFSEQYLEQYHHHGFTVFPGIVPPSLIRDLRKTLAPGRELARELHGPQVQRLQPLKNHHDKLDLGPCRDFTNLPDLVDACKRVLSPGHDLTGIDGSMGIFYEPADSPWSTQWHRDITATSAGVDPDEFARISMDATFFVQVNCALYTDVSTWYVPASDGRPNLEGEPEAAAAAPDVQDMAFEEAEKAGIEYCRSMPGGVQLVLEPGDFAMYRPNGWHIGNYSPNRQRMTLHTDVWKEETREWYGRWNPAFL
jgi:hypothetical protein